MGYGVDEFVRKVIDFIRDMCNEPQALNQTFHFVLSAHLNPQLFAEKLVEAMSTAPRCHDLDASLHLILGHAIDRSRTRNEGADEGDALLDIGGFEALEIERASREVFEGRHGGQFRRKAWF